MALEPPPEHSYTSFEAAEQALYDWSESHGFAVVRKRSKKPGWKTDEPGPYKYVYACDKSGESRSQTSGKRRSKTRKTDCPFEVTITRKAGVWYLEVRHGEHNHEPSLDPAQHPALRKLTEAQEESIKSLTRSHVAPKNILLNLIQQDLNTHVVSQDLYNFRAKLKQRELQGLTRTEALVNMMMEKGDWAVAMETDDNNHVNMLFFAHFQAIELAQAYPEALLIDCTYRTNCYNMPLIHFSGVTPTGKNFSIGFGFLSAESEPQYTWMLEAYRQAVLGGDVEPLIIITDNEQALLNAMRTVYPRVPHLLCRWHNEKNVLQEAKKHWRITGVNKEEKDKNQKLLDEFMARWRAVVLATSKDEFESLYAKLKTDYPTQPALIEYLDLNKYPIKHLFARAWTNDVLHFGITVTSRLEGGHSTLKEFLQNGRGDLLDVVNRCTDLHTIQYREIKYNLAGERDRIPNDINAKYVPWLDPDINKEIVPKALREVVKQHKLNQERPMTECTGQFTRSMGLPCRHTLKAMQDLSLKLTAADFHAFWTFNHSKDEPFLRPPPEPQAPAYREPHVVRTKGRPRQTDGTTRRDPSSWEMRPPAPSFRPFLPPERATASSAAVNTPPPPPLPPPLAPTTNDDDEFDIPLDPELFDNPPLPSADSTPQDPPRDPPQDPPPGPPAAPADDGFIPVEEVIRAAPLNTPAPTAARGRGRPRGRPRGSRARPGARRGGESRVPEGISRPAGRGGRGGQGRGGRGGHRGQGRGATGASAEESFAYAGMEGMTSSWQL